jgi:hypothetical protein
MAQTISFNAGFYTLGSAPGPGSERLFVLKDPRTGRFSLTNQDRVEPTVVNLGLLGDSNPNFSDLIDFPASGRKYAPSQLDTVRGLTANL